MHRRHKERKFGIGCIDAWRRDVGRLIECFHHAVQPFEQILANRPFLTGERPIYADYALCGVIGNFLFPGNTALPENCLMLEAWYTKMRAGNFRTQLDDVQLGEGGVGEGDPSVKDPLLIDVADIEKAVVELKFRPNTYALDVSGGKRPYRALSGREGLQCHGQRCLGGESAVDRKTGCGKKG